MPYITLFSDIFKTHALRERAIPNDEIPHYLRDNQETGHEFPSPILLLCSITYFLDYHTRKFILDFTRIQAPVCNNKYLTQLQTTILQRDPITTIPDDRVNAMLRVAGVQTPNFGDKIHINSICSLLDQIYDNPVLCSVLSYFVRAERTHYPSEFVSIGQEAIDKEILASLQPNVPTQIDYSALFTDVPAPLHTESGVIPYNLIQMWKRNITTMIRRMTQSDRLIFPHYNTGKNISYSSQNLLEEALQGSVPHRQPTRYTTCDLLKHYYHTGNQIGGILELRSAWKWSEIKPRGYYCLGGTDFWASTFMKDFTKSCQELLSSTNPFSRFEVKRIRVISVDEIVITYDYSAFTTSLAELKYFMFYLSTQFDGVLVDVLDVRTGIVSVDFGEYIREYNDTVNVHQVVSLSRLLDRDSRDGDGDQYRQGRSGSLGVGGNIGLSTTLHGVSIGAITDTPEQDSIVGDDALIALLKDQLELYLTIINKLGVINPEKISTFSRPTDFLAGDQRQAYKYLKRPITVNHYGEIIVGFLEFFPNLSKILYPEGDGVHTDVVEDVYTSVKTFCTQWGKYLKLYQSTPWTSSFIIDDDLNWILSCIKTVYRRYKIPMSGTIPGQHCFVDNTGGEEVQREMRFWVPPCDSREVFDTPWMEQLYFLYGGLDVTIPIIVGEEIPLPYDLYPGETGVCTGNRLRSLLVDLGLMTSRMSLTRLPFDEAIYRQSVSNLDSGKTVRDAVVYEYEVEEVPIWYHEVHSSMYSHSTSGPKYGEAMTAISSIREPQYSYDDESLSDGSMEY